MMQAYIKMNKIDVVIAFLAIFSINLLLIDSVIVMNEEQEKIIQMGDNFIVAIFWIEFSYRLWRANKKLEFIKSSWADIIGMIPLSYLFLRIFRLFRVIRILRVTKLTKATKTMTRIEKISKRIRKVVRKFSRLSKKSK